MMVFVVVFSSSTVPWLRHMIRNGEIEEEYLKPTFAGQAGRLSWEPGLACEQ